MVVQTTARTVTAVHEKRSRSRKQRMSRSVAVKGLLQYIILLHSVVVLNYNSAPLKSHIILLSTLYMIDYFTKCTRAYRERKMTERKREKRRTQKRGGNMHIFRQIEGGDHPPMANEERGLFPRSLLSLWQQNDRSVSVDGDGDSGGEDCSSVAVVVGIRSMC